jgi:hypothetical protein
MRNTHELQIMWLGFNWCMLSYTTKYVFTYSARETLCFCMPWAECLVLIYVILTLNVSVEDGGIDSAVIHLHLPEWKKRRTQSEMPCDFTPNPGSLKYVIKMININKLSVLQRKLVWIFCWRTVDLSTELRKQNYGHWNRNFSQGT